MKINSLGINLFLMGAQTLQNHPELCGRPGALISIPDGVRWEPPQPNGDSLASTLFLRIRDAETKIDLGVWPSMDQICPLSGDQLVLFGEFNENYSVARIDRKTSTIIDVFSGRDPMMSPDQHWLIMRPYRHFRSQRSNSEEYLFYDLTTGATKNRMKGLTPYTMGLIGRPVYPVPHDGVPFEFEDQPPEMTHTFRSDAFYWAPDSSAVVFADSVMDKLSIVVVEIQPQGPSTRVFPFDIDGVCESQASDDPNFPIYPVPTVAGIDFGSSGTLIIHFERSNACKSGQRTLYRNDFRAPKPEVHEPPKRRGGTLDGVPFH